MGGSSGLFVRQPCMVLRASGDLRAAEFGGRLRGVPGAVEPSPGALDRQQDWRPTNPVLLFKVLTLRALYGLSNEQAAFKIRTGSRSCAFGPALVGLMPATRLSEAFLEARYQPAP
jgi:hypothetical protein